MMIWGSQSYSFLVHCFSLLSILFQYGCCITRYHILSKKKWKKMEYSTKYIREAKASPNPNCLAKFCLQIVVGWMWNHKCLKVWSLGGLEDYCLLRKQKLVRWHKSLEVSIEVWEFSSTSFLLSKQPMSTIWLAVSCPCCQSSATMGDCTLKCETKWSCSPISYLSEIWSQWQENHLIHPYWSKICWLVISSYKQVYKNISVCQNA